ncbi:MAG: 4-diphosphocytidyl-2-C-methyl-D-erythritol kinase [Myxococcota bacterium]
MEVRVRAPAKVNLFLAIRGMRPDGLHELVTVLQTVDLHDELTAKLLGTPWARQHPAARQLMRLSLTHDAGPGLPVDKSNLIIRSARELLCDLGVPHVVDGDAWPDDVDMTHAPRTELHLTKRIPVAAGMAGGSVDAAATLLALDRLWASDLSNESLTATAARLGADVPFCLWGGTALATGTGADTARVLARGEFHWVVCVSERGLSTRDVYREFDELDLPPSVIEPDVVLQALRTGDAALLASGVHNDLEAAALSLLPDLADGLEALRSAGALQATVSGSGPTLIGLAATKHDARQIAERVGDRFRQVHVVSSPVGGPRVTTRQLQPV